jgi:hypothetical protein
MKTGSSRRLFCLSLLRRDISHNCSRSVAPSELRLSRFAHIQLLRMYLVSISEHGCSQCNSTYWIYQKRRR